MYYRKIAAVSALVSGWVAIVLAFNNNGMAAGVLLIASALAFGSVLVGTSRDDQR